MDGFLIAAHVLRAIAVLLVLGLVAAGLLVFFGWCQRRSMLNSPARRRRRF